MSDKTSSDSETLPFIDDRSLDRFISGECTPDEQLRVERWLAHNESDRNTVDAIREDISIASQTDTHPDTSAALNSLSARLGLDVGRVLPAQATRRDVDRGVFSVGALRGWVRYGAITAALVIIAGISLFPGVRSKGTGTSVPRHYVTAPGQRATVTLEDGSSVTLAPATTLRVLGREVQLSGEALFVVTPDKTSPFTVMANRQLVRVLGTTFSVRAYNDEQSVRLAVKDGRVAVGTDGTEKQSAILAAGDIAKLSPGRTEIFHHQLVDAELAFAKGQLILNGITLHDAIPELERWFDTRILVADTTLLNVRIKGGFPDQTISALVDILEPTLGAVVRRSGRTLTIDSPGRR